MKRFSTLILALGLVHSIWAQAPAESEDVMLQGFCWDSQKETGWAQLSKQAAEIGSTFNLIWLPPSASAEGGGAVGGSNMGYHPRQWNNQTSCWGTADQLKSLIHSLHQKGVKVIADIVVNHRAGDTGWGNFTKDDFGSYGSFQLTADHICSNDEMNTDKSAGSWYGTAKGAKDTGENWNGARDLDHTSEYVQHDIEAYLQWLHGEFGYDGWRYDYCKGFGGKYVGIYNRATSPYLSVGEYWDGSYDPVAAWIEATGKESMAFDFPSKYAALNNGLARGNYANMSWIEDQTTWRPVGMIHHHNYNRYAVTFVDNHDTYRDGNKYTGNVEAAYAFLLSSPGIPCVFWPHWTAHGQAIASMVKVRRAAGIHSQSDVRVTQRATYYEAVSAGHHGTLVTRIGKAAPSDAPTGYHLAIQGEGWAMYLSDNVTEGIAEASAAPATEVPQWQVKAGRLEVQAPHAASIRVVDESGRTVAWHQGTPNLSVSLPQGIYVLKVGDWSQKVAVK